MISANLKKRSLTSFFLILLLFLIFISKPILLFILIIVGIFSIIEFSQIIKKISKNKIYSLISNLSFIIYIFTFCLVFFLFSNYINSKIILFSLLICCIASDIGGYIFGKILKGPKLTKISPNKTISGSIGSILLSSISLQGIYYIIASNMNLKIVIIGIIVSISCQIGDIFFSYLKRKAKIKDTGKFLPGHGGFLDRIDGILLALPVGLICIGILF